MHFALYFATKILAFPLYFALYYPQKSLTIPLYFALYFAQKTIESPLLERGGGARTRDENFLREGRGRLGRPVLR